MSFKNIRIKKRGGGTRLQRVQVLKSGKYKFVKNKAISRRRKVTKSKSRKRSNPKRSVKRTAKRKKKVSLFYTTAAVYAFAKPIQTVMQGPTNIPNLKLAAKQALLRLTGLWIDDMSFTLQHPLKTYGAMILAGLGKKYIGKYVNKGLRQIPLLGEYLSA